MGGSDAPMSDEMLVERAEALADDVLFPAALNVDAGGEVPVEQLNEIAAAGLYGLTSTEPTHGHAAAPETVYRVLEALASGCLTTGFVFAQHLGASAAAAASELPVHDELAAPLAAGHKRGGVAFAHILRPGPPMTTAVPTGTDGGYTMSGTAPWVTGWGHIDVFHAAARDGDDIVWALLDADESDSLQATRLDLAAVNSSATVVLEYRDHQVPAERITRIENFEAWRDNYRLGLRGNGSLALGVARRCCTLLDLDAYTTQLDQVRADLDTASTDDMPAARAAASAFAVQAAAALAAASGGSAVTRQHHAQRLVREATFLLVQGQTPQIREHLLDGFVAH